MILYVAMVYHLLPAARLRQDWNNTWCAGGSRPNRIPVRRRSGPKRCEGVLTQLRKPCDTLREQTSGRTGSTPNVNQDSARSALIACLRSKHTAVAQLPASTLWP